jgi:pullulanase
VLQADAQAASGAPVAAAVWLDATRLQWPGAPADGRYRLLHAPGGGIVVAPGAPAQGAGLALPLQPVAGPLPVDLQLRHRHLGDGVRLALAPADATPARLQALHRGQLLLVQEDAAGRVLHATGVQAAAALDALYAPAEALTDLGVTLTRRATRFRLWAPTAQAVHLCLHASDTAPAQPAVHALQRDDATGSWQLQLPGLPPARYARYLVDVWVPGTGLVRQRVTDPYAVSLGTDGRHTWVGSLDDPATQPAGWAGASRPAPRTGTTDLAIYELHVRDFSIGDASVPPAHRGKYLAFTQAGSHGMRHLRALAQAGMTDVHLLPVFDIASVPEKPAAPRPPCPKPRPTATGAAGRGDGAGRQRLLQLGLRPAALQRARGQLCQPGRRRRHPHPRVPPMVQALHAAGLRVGMDVVYNHTTAAGQHPQSVLDRIVPGYYHRLDANGRIETARPAATTPPPSTA